MRNENELNAFLSAKLRKNGVHFIKTSDRFTPGVSDFLIWLPEMSIALESKFIETFPESDIKPALTKHPFTPTQINFMRKMRKSGHHTHGLVYVKDGKTMYLMDFATIEESKGNPNKIQIQKGMEIPATAAGVATLIVALGGSVRK